MAEKLKVPPGWEQRVGAIQVATGARIRFLREATWNGGPVSQTNLAAICGANQSTWSRWENGEAMPDALAMMAFCVRYDVDLNFLYFGWPAGIDRRVLRRFRLEQPALVQDEKSDTD